MTAKDTEAELVLQTVEQITAILTRSVEPCDYQRVLLMKATPDASTPPHEPHLWVPSNLATGSITVRFCRGDKQ